MKTWGLHHGAGVFEEERVGRSSLDAAWDPMSSLSPQEDLPTSPACAQGFLCNLEVF